METDQQSIEKMPPPLEEFQLPVQSWKIELHEKLLVEKINQIHVEERRRKDEMLRNCEQFKIEAEMLLNEIKNYDPAEKWQYKKGLRLMYLGTKLGDEKYKRQGLQFYDLACEIFIK